MPSHPDQPKIKGFFEDAPIVAPPRSFTVEHEHKPVLYLPNGKVLVKRAGF